MKNKQGISIPTAVLQSGKQKFTWLNDLRNLSIGDLIELYAYSEAIVETVREPLIILDSSLHVKTCNTAFFRMFKVTPEETYGKLIYKLNGGEWNIPELKRLLEDILPKNSHFEDYEVNHEFDKLGKKTMLLNARRIVLDENKTQLILLAIEDVTEKRNLEKRKDEFIATASHELNNPITSVKAYLYLVEKRLAKDEKSVYFLQNIGRQMDKMHNLIADMMDIRKIEVGKLVFEKQTFDLASIIKRVVVDFQLLTDTHEIVRECEDELKAYGNKDRIEQVLINLVTNAIKYSPKGKKIIVSAKRTDGMIEASVKDFGIGIDKEKQKYLFTPYYTVEAKGPRGDISAGLGLYIASEIIKSHEGRLWLKSSKGKGSTFYFSLPAASSKKK